MGDGILVGLYALGLIAAVGTAFAVYERVKVEPHSAWAIAFVALCAFALFPFINLLVSVGCIIALSEAEPLPEK